jgi:coenzyme F420-dependent glucose-6-phosphate dehydrogenase
MVPIYISAGGALVAKFVGRSADGFICTSGKPREFYTEALLPNLDVGLEAAGRDKDSIDRMIEIKVSFDTDKARALEDTRFWAALSLSAEEKLSVEDAMEMEKLADALPIDRVAKRWIVTNDPAEVVEKIRPYVDLGFRHLVFHAPGPDQARFLKLYAEAVLPILRKTFG